MGEIFIERGVFRNCLDMNLRYTPKLRLQTWPQACCYGWDMRMTSGDLVAEGPNPSMRWAKVRKLNIAGCEMKS